GQGRTQMRDAGSVFIRDQGVAPWEGNLAAFLIDLNTNIWGENSYQYSTDATQPSRGRAFDDALALLRYRYRTNWKNLLSVSANFGNRGVNAFKNDSVDGYG